MKRILFIAPEAFPVMTSESICNSKVAYALAEAGYYVDVFTCDDRETYPEDNRIDAFLRCHENLKIHPIKNSKIILSRKFSIKVNVVNLFKNLSILLRTGYWYNGISIPYAIYQAIEEHCKEIGGFRYDIMITRATYCDLAAILLKRKYGVFWNANWNDPFPDRKFPEPYGRGSDTKLPYFENRIFNEIQKRVDLHTFPSERLRDYQLKCFKYVSLEKTLIIPHMAHSSILSLVTRSKKSDGVFRMAHCGSVNYPRNPRNFLIALSKISQELHITDKEFKCYFVGRYDEDLDALIKELNLSSIVELLPPMSYSDSLGFLSTCDISLIIEAICDEGIYLPTKFVDAVQISIPIFCVSPKNGTLPDMIKRYNIGYCCDNTSIEDISKALYKLFIDIGSHNVPKLESGVPSYFYESSIIRLFKSFIL